MPPMKPRSIPSVLGLVLPLAMMLACTERGAETRPSPSASEAKVAEPAKAEPIKAAAPVAPTEVAKPTEPTKAAAPVPPTEVAPPSEPAEPEEVDEPAPPKELTDAERVDAYVASCAHRFTVVPEEEVAPEDGGTVDECDVYGWDQNCAADPSGCWDAGQACIRGCGKPCNACQDECAGGCDQCKAACAPGSTDCIRKCAEDRLACRNKCMTAHGECQSTDCPKQEASCNAAFEKKRKKKCPQCLAISQCMELESGAEDTAKACASKFPKASKECFDWCVELYEDEGAL